MFDLYGVSHPTGCMSWYDFEQLLYKFPQKNDDGPIKSLFLQDQDYLDVVQLAFVIGSSKKIKLMNPTTLEITINTNEWKEAFQIAMDCFRSGRINNLQSSSGELEYFASSNMFINGTAAMTISDLNTLQTHTLAKLHVKNYKEMNIGIVTIPIDPRNSEINPFFNIPTVYSINQHTSNLNDSWELIKFINGDEPLSKGKGI